MDSRNWHKNIAQVKNVSVNFFGLVWSWRHEILVVLIFLVALLLLLQSFGDRHYFYNGDYNRDYLIAHHILAYHEFPLVGPEGGFGATGASPAYFYFLTLPLLIKDSIVFLGIFNVFLQMTALLLVYLLGRMMFGKSVGLGALAIFATNENIIYQSNFVWQPHIMQPFLLLSLLLLFISYTGKNYWFFLSSIVCFVFSSVLHQSVLALIPFYLIAAFLTLRANQKQFWRHYAGAVACFFGIFMLLYAPLLFYFSKNQASPVSLLHPMSTFLSENNEGVTERFLSRTELLSSVFFTHNAVAVVARQDVEVGLSHSFLASVLLGASAYASSIIVIVFLAIVIAASVALVFYFRNARKQQTIFFLLLIGAIVQFLIVTAFVSSDYFYLRYFTPLFGIFTIAIAELVSNIIPQKSVFWIAHIGVFVMLIFISSPKITERLATAKRYFISDPIEFFRLTYITPPFIVPIRDEIIAIKERENRRDFNFFDIQSYRSWRTPVFWVPLERELATRLVKVDDNNFRHFSPIGFPQYVFFDCEFAQDANHECINPFLREHPDFRVIKELTSDPPIYEARRTL